MKKLILILAFVLFVPAAGWGATYYMRADGTAADKEAASGPCDTQADCMSVATHNAETFSPGDTIYLCDDGGEYAAQLTVPSSGSSGDEIIYDGVSGDFVELDAGFDFNGKDYIIAGRFWTDTEIPIDGDHCLLTRVISDGSSDNGVLISGASNGVYNCVLYNPTGDGIEITADAAVQNCIFESIGGLDINENGGTANASHNYADADGDPLFIDAANDDFTLQPSSPCIDEGAIPAVATSDRNLLSMDEGFDPNDIDSIEVYEMTGDGWSLTDTIDTGTFLLSTLDGTASVHSSDTDLTDYINHKFVITDTAGKTCIGYVKDAVTPISMTDLEGEWLFEDGSGSTAADTSGNNNDGTIEDMAAPDWVAGVAGGAHEFSEDGFLSITDSGNLDFQPDDSFSLGGWISVKEMFPLWHEGLGKWLDTTSKFFGRGGYTGSVGIGVKAYWDDTGDPEIEPDLEQVKFTTGSRGVDEIQYTSSPIDLDEFYHVFFVYTPGMQYTYINGELVNSRDNSDGVEGSFSGDWHVFSAHGCPGGSAGDMAGIADEIRIASRAYTASEIASLYTDPIQESDAVQLSDNWMPFGMDGDQYDFDGNKIWDNDSNRPCGPWAAGLDIGPYGYSYGKNIMLMGVW